MRKKFFNRLCMGLAVFLMLGSLTACGDTDRGKVIFTTGFAKNELFRIGDVSCTMAEYMLYLTNTQNRYEEVFGQEIWGVTFEETTFEDNMKDIVLAEIAQMKSVYLLALEKEITLTDEEEQLLKLGAEEYFASLTETEVEVLNVTEDTVLELYREKALADKVYEQIIAEINPEISDDEARTITVEQIFLKTSTTDTEGKTIAYTESMKADVLEKMQDIREMAVNGEQGFTELAGKYSEEETIRISFKKGQMDAALEEAAFNLQTDEISEIVETAQGYYLLKCISTFNREETDANKLLLVEERKNEAFGQEYETFVDTLARKLNESLWQQVDFIHEDGVTTDSFFEVYQKYMATD